MKSREEEMIKGISKVVGEIREQLGDCASDAMQQVVPNAATSDDPVTDEPPRSDDLSNGLRHAADDHPCCEAILIAAADAIDQMAEAR